VDNEAEYLKLCTRFPHCDALVLHSRPACQFCAMPEFDVLHDWRDAHGINYTGENYTTRKPCPAEERRSKQTIDRWYGNRASK
jgi:hypothetical protein